MYNENYFKIYRDIINLQLKTQLHRAGLLRALGYKRNHTYFHEAIKTCIDEGIIVEHDCLGIGKIKMLEINYKKLDKFIRKHSKEFNEWGKFIEISTGGLFRY
jgi:hypothetical protein